jgi:S-adenosylmethionine decarboxylase
VVIIAESHLSFHSFSEKDYFFFDLFSCKPFDVEAAKQFIVEAFEVQDVETHYAERGRHFPRTGPAVAAKNRTERRAHHAEPVPVGV